MQINLDIYVEGGKRKKSQTQAYSRQMQKMDPEAPRRTQKNPERPRGTQKDPEEPRKTQKN